MSNGRENIELDAGRRLVESLGSDEDYAGRYEKLLQDQQVGALRKFTQMFLGLLFVLFLLVALLTGWYREALLGMLALAGFGIVAKIVRNAKVEHQREQSFDGTVERQNGIDKRWGRLAAERKKKKKC